MMWRFSLYNTNIDFLRWRKLAMAWSIAVLLIAVGCLMDVFSAIAVIVPLVAPLGLAFGVDPIHLGILFLANLELGYLTPPVGLNLFLAAQRFQRPLLEVARATLPLLAVLASGGGSNLQAILDHFDALGAAAPGAARGRRAAPEPTRRGTADAHRRWHRSRRRRRGAARRRCSVRT